jgi:thioredoxin reductase
MANDNVHDIIIVGGGPAGCTVGPYAARTHRKTFLLERMGSQNADAVQMLLDGMMEEVHFAGGWRGVF